MRPVVAKIVTHTRKAVQAPAQSVAIRNIASSHADLVTTRAAKKAAYMSDKPKEGIVRKLIQHYSSASK